MRVGIVSPYSFEVPGGVQLHVRDFAEELLLRGHDVSVLAPAEDDTPLPPYVTSAGRAVPVGYNGSVARLAFGPVVSRRASRWLKDGAFDVLHLHEPLVPSVALTALLQAQPPIVATFHSSQQRSRALQVAHPLLRPGLEKISARIAVSEDARRTVVEHVGGDAVVIPNGVEVDRFARALPTPAWQGRPGAPTFAFLGRLDESRKGLPVLLHAMREVRARVPGARFLVAGHGDLAGALADAGLPPDDVERLGGITDDEKSSLLASVDAYVAPQLGGESFGIVLVEAMSAGAPVVASDLVAFRAVLDDGATGRLFPTGDSGALAAALLDVVTSPERTAALREEARRRVRRYDWSTVATQVLEVYAMVTQGDGGPPAGLLGRLLRGRS